MDLVAGVTKFRNPFLDYSETAGQCRERAAPTYRDVPRNCPLESSRESVPLVHPGWVRGLLSRQGIIVLLVQKLYQMFSIFHAPRRYPRIYAPYYDGFNFYDGRENWIASTEGAPKEAVLLYSLHWLHLEVYNGGFWQYFYNSTGTSYPEASRGFSAIGMPNVAKIVDKAASRLGDPFPLETDERRKIVGGPGDRMDFGDLDTQFYALADTDTFFRKLPKFVPFAEEYADRYEQTLRD